MPRANRVCSVRVVPISSIPQGGVVWPPTTKSVRAAAAGWSKTKLGVIFETDKSSRCATLTVAPRNSSFENRSRRLSSNGHPSVYYAGLGATLTKLAKYRNAEDVWQTQVEQNGVRRENPDNIQPVCSRSVLLLVLPSVPAGRLKSIVLVRSAGDQPFNTQATGRQRTCEVGRPCGRTKRHAGDSFSDGWSQCDGYRRAK